MKVVLDTNILISALISKTAPPHHIYQAWRDKRLTVLTCACASSLQKLADW